MSCCNLQFHQQLDRSLIQIDYLCTHLNVWCEVIHNHPCAEKSSITFPVTLISFACIPLYTCIPSFCCCSLASSFFIHFPRYLSVSVHIPISFWSFDITNKQYHLHFVASPLNQCVQMLPVLRQHHIILKLHYSSNSYLYYRFLENILKNSRHRK